MSTEWAAFLMPGGRLKLASRDLYALGTHRGGIDERWFASTTQAANEGAPADEGLSYVVHEKDKFTLKGAIEAHGPELGGCRSCSLAATHVRSSGVFGLLLLVLFAGADAEPQILRGELALKELDFRAAAQAGSRN